MVAAFGGPRGGEDRPFTAWSFNASCSSRYRRIKGHRISRIARSSLAHRIGSHDVTLERPCVDVCSGPTHDRQLHRPDEGAAQEGESFQRSLHCWQQVRRHGQGRGMTPLLPTFSAIGGPKGVQRARSARSWPKAARASVARPLYLKLLTRQRIKPGTRHTKMPQRRQTKCND